MNKTFDPVFFKHLKEAETGHFWFSVRKKWILDFIQRMASAPVNVLEIGCGTGNVSNFLANQGYNVVGCEYYREALNIAWPDFDKVQGSAIDLPFADHSFDIVGLFDVIEHFENETQLLKEARRVLRQDGLLILTVPARYELWSYVDELSFHKRRYSTESIYTILIESGITPISIQYIFMLLYLPMRLLRRKPQGQNAGDSLRINKSINLIARLIFDLERIISRFIKLPIGTSIIAVAKK